MRHKDEYHKVKTYSHDGYTVFLEVKVRPDWHPRGDKRVLIDHVYYKVVYKSREQGKRMRRVKIELITRGVFFFDFHLSARNCDFYADVEDEWSRLLYLDNAKAFFKYLGKFEDDLRYRLEIVYAHLGDKMPERCKEALREVMNKI
jgi:hypothetical protein